MVITDVNQVVYQGDGATTAFPFTFRIIDATDIKLLLIDADGTETDITSDYFVDTNTNTVYYPGYAPGAEPGLANQPAPVQEGQRLVVYRELPVTQEKDLGEKWPFFVIELALDKLTMLIQQVKGIWDRCLKVSVGQEATAPDFNYTVPIEAGKTFRVKDDGTGFELTEDPAVAHAAAEAAQEAAERAQGAAETAQGKAEDALDLIKEKAAWFDNVAAMKAAEGLQVGMLAGTKGYYSINDGGSSIYSIRAKTQDDVDDGGSVIFLNNGNVAELITDGTINIKQFGAVGDANYFDYQNGKIYKNISLTNATWAKFCDNVNGKWYVSATYTDEGTYEKNGKHYYDSQYTIEAPYYDNVNGKWYVSATYADEANARVVTHDTSKFNIDWDRWYYNAEFSDEAHDDTQAFQNAINYADTLNPFNDVVIVIPSVCHVTTLSMINTGYTYYHKQIVFRGPGGFFSVAQRLFVCAYGDPIDRSRVRNYVFDGVSFTSIAHNGHYIITGYPFQNIWFKNCKFRNIDTIVNCLEFMGSFKFISCSMVGGDDYLIKTVSGEYIGLDNCRIFSRNGGLLQQIDGEQGGTYNDYVLKFNVTNCLFDQITAPDIIYIKRRYEVYFTDNTVEATPYVINAEPIDDSYETGQIVVANNSFVYNPKNDAWCRLSTDNLTGKVVVNYVLMNNGYYGKPLLDATSVDIDKLIKKSGERPVAFIQNSTSENNAKEHIISPDNQYTCDRGIEILTNSLVRDEDYNVGLIYPWFYSNHVYNMLIKGKRYTYRDGENHNNYFNLAGNYTIRLVAGTDLNDITAPGTYRCLSASDAASMVNCPYSNSNFKLVVVMNGSENYLQQFLFSGRDVYMRSYYNASWGTWKTTAYAEEVLQLQNGQTVTFSVNNAIKKNVDNSFVSFYGSSHIDHGAVLQLNGKDRTYSPGGFLLSGKDGTNSKNLLGLPTGTLTWDGQPIQTTSDKRKKTAFGDLSDSVLDAWANVQWQQFKYIDAVKRKGEANCRFHTGIVAQDVKDVCGDGILKYGILCHDVQEATDEHEAIDLWTVRYEEALCMEAAYQRRRADRLEERIARLEAKL